MRNDGITYRDSAGRARPLVPNTILSHPFLKTGRWLLIPATVDRYQYRFLRVLRAPDGARPYGGKILVENCSTQERREFYAHLFDINWGRENRRPGKIMPS